jgi:hypothetical protein
VAERSLGGGRFTPGVVRVGDTVRRPPRPSSSFVRLLLAHLERRGFDAAPRHLGTDEQGREVFTWLNLGIDGPPPAEQARRIRVFCEAYGTDAGERVITGVVGSVAANVERLRTAGRVADAEWWHAQLGWLERHRAEL